MKSLIAQFTFGFRLGITFSLGWLATACSDRSASKPEQASPPPPRPVELDTSEKGGRELFAIHCQSCHGESGQGVAGIFPTLENSPRLQVPGQFVHGLIHGYPAPPPGEPSPWVGEMPVFSHLTDEQLMRLANYTLQRWGAGDSAKVTVEIVAEQRAKP